MAKQSGKKVWIDHTFETNSETLNKDLAGKPDMDLIEPEFLEDLAKVLTHGAQKYGRYNWRKACTDEELAYYRSAALRHMNEFRKGEINDPETGLPHTAHVAANLMFLDYFEAGERG